MIRKIVTEKAPAAIGPYSQGICVPQREGSFVFVSGQLPLDPQTGALVEGTIQVLTKSVLDNIEAILIAAGSSMSAVVKTEIFLTDLQRDFAGMNEEYAQRFDPNKAPARQTVQVAALPKGATIEISCIAVVGYD